jgi:hypothetical protein
MVSFDYTEIEVLNSTTLPRSLMPMPVPHSTNPCSIGFDVG